LRSVLGARGNLCARGVVDKGLAQGKPPNLRARIQASKPTARSTLASVDFTIEPQFDDTFALKLATDEWEVNLRAAGDEFVRLSFEIPLDVISRIVAEVRRLMKLPPESTGE
jgi:hypothetical protein